MVTRIDRLLRRLRTQPSETERALRDQTLETAKALSVLAAVVVGGATLVRSAISRFKGPSQPEVKPSRTRRSRRVPQSHFTAHAHSDEAHPTHDTAQPTTDSKKQEAGGVQTARAVERAREKSDILWALNNFERPLIEGGWGVVTDTTPAESPLPRSSGAQVIRDNFASFPVSLVQPIAVRLLLSMSHGEMILSHDMQALAEQARLAFSQLSSAEEIDALTDAIEKCVVALPSWSECPGAINDTRLEARVAKEKLVVDSKLDTHVLG